MTKAWIVYGRVGFAGHGPVAEAGGERKLSMGHAEAAVAVAVAVAEA